MTQPWTADGDALRLAVRVTTRARKAEAAGLVEVGEGRLALAVRIDAPPVDGAANAALVAFLAKALEVPKRAPTIVSGETSRLKIVRIEGADPEALARLCAQ